MVTTAGRHEISVLAGGEPVAGSPFALGVAPGQLHPGSCSLSGAGVRSVQLGREMKLEVRLADCFGNSIADAGCIEAHDVQVSAQPVRGDESELRCWLVCLAVLGHFQPGCQAHAAVTSGMHALSGALTAAPCSLGEGNAESPCTC